jgi:hypothetical protein
MLLYKTVNSLFVLLLLFFYYCPAAFAQSGADRQKVAVYMAGGEPQDILGVHKVLGGELAKAISGSGRYTAVDRTSAILEQLSKEHGYQRSGAVNEKQIKALGRQFGVQYLCIVEISAIKGGSYYLDVRLVDVESAEIMKSATANSYLRDAHDMVSAAQGIGRDLMEMW